MNKTCQNCKSEFVIDQEDLNFYEKIQVPEPTFCPQCRMIRRMAIRNERSLYKDECDKCKKSMLSMYAPESPYTVYCKSCWFADDWDALSFGQDYDFTRPFFEQFKELHLKAPQLGLSHIKENTNSNYGNFVSNTKNVYLGFSVINCENIMYSRSVDDSRDCMDCSAIAESELCYEAIESGISSRSQYIYRVGESINCAFVYDASNCQDCFMSCGIRNKRYVFRNQQLTKEQYKEEMAKIDLSSRKQIEELKKEFQEMMSKFIYKYCNIIQSTESTGDSIVNCKNAQECFDVYGIEDCKYVARAVGGIQDTYDSYGGTASELIYEVIGGIVDSQLARFGVFGQSLQDTHYTDTCIDNKYIFGCASLRKKQYCILNKQYTKEEYEALVPKIIEHMNQMPYQGNNGREYRYGEFFPIEISPFAYNETLAYEYFPLTKEETEAKGYRWRDEDKKDFGITKQPQDLPDRIDDVQDEVLKEIIGCAHQGNCQEKCTTAFKITPQELQFYRMMKLPLPHLCSNCRHGQRLAQRNPLQTWPGKCMCAGTQSDNGVYTNQIAQHPPHGPNEHCQNTFQTPYAPGTPNITYCEQCYLAEVV